MYYLLSTILWAIMGNPLLILAILAALYFIDRRYFCLLPSPARYFQRRRRMAGLAATIRLNPADANSQLELGALHLERGDAARALPLLEQARQRNADSARIHALLGAGYRRLGRDAEARAALEKAVNLNPKIGYGEPYYHLLALALKSGSRDESALAEYCEKILSFGSPEIFYRSGRVLLAAGDKEAAKTMFKEAVANYQASPKGFRRAHRRWAAAARIFLMFSD